MTDKIVVQITYGHRLPENKSYMVIGSLYSPHYNFTISMNDNFAPPYPSGGLIENDLDELIQYLMEIKSKIMADKNKGQKFNV